MTDFAKLGKIFLWISASMLAISLFLLPLLLGATNNTMYAKGYEANDAYERISEADVWIITSNVQEFFQDEFKSLDFFSFAEKEHLEEVKEVINLGWTIFILCVIVFVISFGLTFRFNYQNTFGIIKEKKEVFDFSNQKKKKFHLKQLSKVFMNSSIVLFALLVLLSLLASSWDWFFTLFHNTFFSGQWMFEPTTLMIQLWDHPFFLVAAKFIALRIVAIAIILFACSYALENAQKKVKL